MKNRFFDHIKNLLLPCVIFSSLTGCFSAVLITFFKSAVEWVIHVSSEMYGIVHQHPVWLPLLIAGASVIGFAASYILSFSHSCRGGGIPTSVAAIRGAINFNWLSCILIMPLSALLTFICGLPLGTEGPCVQIGTAIGDGTVRMLGRNGHKSWRRYIMTGGASAGFSIATASPITAVIFSMEELHKHFSPLLLTVASISVISAQITAHILAFFGIGSEELFSVSVMSALPSKFLFAPLIVGLVCGIFSILFTRCYHFVDKLIRGVLKKLSIKIVFPILFAAVAMIGFFVFDSLGTGHSLTELLLTTHIKWYLLILILLIRMIFMMLSNTSGVTGGVFLPTLAFGAILGSLCADGMIALGLIEAEYYTLLVVLGITAFLGSTSRIPLTAGVFAIEALGGINNILSVIIAATVALLIVETSGLEDFTDTIIESKINSISKGKAPTVIEVPLTIAENSFAVGKDLRDILWPNACVIVSFERSSADGSGGGIAVGDIITVHYETYNPKATAEELKALAGEQSEQITNIMISHP